MELTKQNHQQRQPPKTKKHKTNVEACKKKLSFGQFIAAIRILSSNGVAPSTADTLYELQQKYPSAPPPLIPSDNIDAAAVSVDVPSVVKAITSFPKGTTCGRDGLRAHHLLDVTSGAASAVAEELLRSIT